MENFGNEKNTKSESFLGILGQPLISLSNMYDNMSRR